MGQAKAALACKIGEKWGEVEGGGRRGHIFHTLLHVRFSTVKFSSCGASSLAYFSFVEDCMGGVKNILL